jgi:hypothetical protein
MRYTTHSASLPRSGIKGTWDKFIGPGASLSENLVALLPATFFAVLLVVVALNQNAPWSLLQYVVAGFLAFDMVGGIATTATRAAKRWYHRSDQSWEQHMKFIVPHVAHIALFSWMFVGKSILFATLFAGILIAGSIVILCSNLAIRRSVAHLLVFFALVTGLLDFSVDPLMTWFIPALFIKLFASYLPAEQTA